MKGQKKEKKLLSTSNNIKLKIGRSKNLIIQFGSFNLKVRNTRCGGMQERKKSIR